MAGLEVNVELHSELGLDRDRLQVSHITTSFKRFWVWEKDSGRGKAIKTHVLKGLIIL